jgi:hypothetical protein
MSDQSTDEDPQLRSLPREWKRLMLNEWNSRTSFGKLFYPFWLFESAFQWSVFIGVFLLVEFVSLSVSAGDWFEQKVPSTHKDD